MFDDLDHISFAEWLIALNACAVKAGYKNNPPFLRITGQLFWYADYQDGLSPESALEAAAMDGLEFGADYLD
jgi:hypothetical protein